MGGAQYPEKVGSISDVTITKEQKAHLFSLLHIPTFMVELSIPPPVPIAVGKTSQECIKDDTCRTKLCLKRGGGTRGIVEIGTGGERLNGGSNHETRARIEKAYTLFHKL